MTHTAAQVLHLTDHASHHGDEDVAVASRRVRIAKFFHYISSELKDEEDFMSLLSTIMLTVCFAAIVIGFLGQENAFKVEESLFNDVVENANFAGIHKIFRDAHSVADFWSWLRVGAVPLIMQGTAPESRYFGEGYPQDLLNHVTANVSATDGENNYLRYNYMLTGIRLGQVRGEETACRAAVSEWEDRPCFPGRFDLPPDYGRPGLNADARVEWLFLSKTKEERNQQLLDMEDGCAVLDAKGRDCLCSSCEGIWLDEATSVVELRFALMNPTLGIITQTQVLFLFSRGGRIWKRIDVRSVRTGDPPLSALLAGGIYTAMCISTVWFELQDLRTQVKWYAGPKIRDTNVNDIPYPYSGSFSAVSKSTFASKY